MIRWLLDLLYPPRCVLCHGFLQDSRVPVCDKCGKMVLSQNIHSRRGKYFTRCVTPLTYKDTVRESIHRFKFRGRKFYAKTYGLWVAAATAQEFDGIDMATWVPTGRKRLRRRGYDQAMELCVVTAEALGVPAEACLRKVRKHPPQSTLTNAEQRRRNVKDAYAVRKDAEIAGKKILLVDDVVTTGSTLEECSRVLRQAGAKEVVCAAVAATK